MIPLPEPFLSFPTLLDIVIPNSTRGVPGVTFAKDARIAGIQDATNAPLGATTPPFPYPYPPRCRSTITALIEPGSPAHTLAKALWAYGWCEGMLASIASTDASAPGALTAKQGVWTIRFPNPEFAQWESYMGGFPPKPWDEKAVRTVNGRALYGPPKWVNWFHEYHREAFTAPTCYWKHTK